MVKPNEIRDIFKKEMEGYKGTKDLRTLCEITMTFTLFEILDELQKIRKNSKGSPYSGGGRS